MKLNAGRNLQTSVYMYILAGVSKCGFQSSARAECCRFLQVCDTSFVKLAWQLWGQGHTSA